MSLITQLASAIWTDNSAAGRWIVLVTLVVALRALWQILGTWTRLNGERTAVSICIENLHAQRHPSTEPEAPKPAIKVESMVHLVSPLSLMGERLNAIQNLQHRRVRVHLELLQKITDLRIAELGGLTAGARASSLCLLLGLFGTFVGLTAMVQEIQIALPDNTTQNLESWAKGIENLRSVMGGIRTAFSTSLVGMLAAIPLVVLDGRLGRKLNSLRSDLDRFTSLELLPALVPSFQDESLLERLTTQLEGSFDKLESLFANNRLALERLEGAEKIFLEILEDLRASARNQATRDFGELATALNGTQQAVTDVVSQLPRIVGAIEGSQKNFLNRLNPWHQLATGLGQLWSGTLVGIPGPVWMLGVSTLVGLLILRGLGWISGW